MFLVIRPLLNRADLAAWARQQGFHDLVPSSWHVTLINSPSRLDRQAIQLDEKALHLPPSASRNVVRLGYFIALRISGKALDARHAELISSGARHRFDDYKPHVTFSASRQRDLADVAPYTGALLFGPEKMEPDFPPTSAGDRNRRPSPA